MKKRLLAALFTLALACLPGAAQAAAAPKWEIDPPHCTIMFKIDHIFVKVPGVFKKYQGDIRFDPANPAAGSVDLAIDTASIDTRVKQRDHHLLSPDFFEAEKFPRITFKSQSVKKLGKGRFQAEGILTIKGVARKIVLPFRFFGIKDAPLRKGVKVAGFEAFYTLDRLAYGVGNEKFVKMGVVGKMVEVSIYLELIRK